MPATAARAVRVRTIFVATATAITLFAAGILLLPDRWTAPWSDISEVVAALLATGILVLPARSSTGRERLAWSMLAAGMASWAVGETIWSVYEVGLGREAPFPSLADIGYMGWYPLTAAGLVALPTIQAQRAGRLRIFVDLNLFAVGLFGLLMPLVFTPIWHAGTGDFATALALAYPVMDAALVLVALNTPTRLLRGRPWLGPLVLGLLVIAVSDTAFAIFVANESYVSGTLLDTGWFAGVALIAAAGMWRQVLGSDVTTTDTGPPPRFVLALPMLPMGAMIGYGLYLQATASTTPPAFVYAACLAASLLVVRQLLVHYENLDLTQALRRGEEQLRRILETANDPYIEVDGDGAITEWNRQAERVFGWTREEIIGSRLIDTVLPERRRQRRPEPLAQLAGLRPAGSSSQEALAVRRDGSEVPVEMTAWATGQATHMFVRDIRDRKFAEDRLLHHATHDSLTGLPNRLQVSEALTTAKRAGQTSALLLLDLDGFKEVNDTLGHDAGDRLLVDVARRLATTLPSDHIVARLGGDEFAVITGPPSDVEQAYKCANELLEALGRPFELDGVRLYVRGSIGISLSSPDRDTPSDVLRRADVAMYRAKRLGSGVALHSDDDDSTPDRLSMAAELKHAIDSGTIEVHYQPKVELETEAVVGVEALARWQRPGLPAVPPTVFVALAEQTGLMPSLTEHVLGQAVADCARWRSEGLDLGVAVNVGAAVMRQSSLAELVTRLLVAHHVPPGALTLEITETALADTGEHALGAMRDLTTLGVRITIDDFGTGYSSMTYLKRLPISELKVDKSFVADVAHDERDKAIVGAIIAVANRLGINVVAEGVETRATHVALVELGCLYAQGYLYGRAVPVSELIGQLSEQAGNLP